MDGDRRLDSKEEISNHVLSFYKDLFSKKDWLRPSLDNLDFSMIDEANADWFENKFDEEEVQAAVFKPFFFCWCGGAGDRGVGGRGLGLGGL